MVAVKNLGNGWSKSIVLENKVVINFDFLGAEPKNQVIWTIRCKVMQGLYIEKITCFASLCLYLYLYLHNPQNKEYMFLQYH